MLGNKRAKRIANNVEQVKKLIVEIACDLKLSKLPTKLWLKSILPKEDYNFITKSPLVQDLVNDPDTDNTKTISHSHKLKVR